ncbi:RluA family pseudouridine synthase [candidate division KSB1 bacterium]|nr:RluA family pseudouridine synthase [candidate division KSB1 bacterium]
MQRKRISVIYSDTDLLVIDKPSGIACTADRYDPQALHLLPILEPQHGKLWVVHRLDRDTSGVLVLARNETTHGVLNEQFQNRQVRKIYHALVIGTPGWDEKTIELALRVDADRLHRTRVDPDRGKPSVTRVRVLQKLGAFSLLEAQPLSGRTHQIRVHLAAAGFPVMVDPLYGNGEPFLLSRLKPRYRPSEDEEKPLLARLGLHAAELELNHPVDNHRMAWSAPYSKDFKATLYQLQKLQKKRYKIDR